MCVTHTISQYVFCNHSKPTFPSSNKNEGVSEEWRREICWHFEPCQGVMGFNYRSMIIRSATESQLARNRPLPSWKVHLPPSWIEEKKTRTEMWTLIICWIPILLIATDFHDQRRDILVQLFLYIFLIIFHALSSHKSIIYKSWPCWWSEQRKDVSFLFAFYYSTVRQYLSQTLLEPF